VVSYYFSSYCHYLGIYTIGCVFMNELFGLLFTLALGMFLFLGAFVVFVSHNSDQFMTFSYSLAFSVMLMIMGIDLIPESYDLLGKSGQAFFFLLVFAVLGFVLLKILDYFIPDHEDDLTTSMDDKKNLAHIGLVSSIALVIHNILEGMAIYSSVTSSVSSSFLIALGVGLHNIPLGMIITSTFYKANGNKKRTLIILFFVSLSTFVGGLLLFLFDEVFLSPFINGCLLSMTVGMLFYICFCELFPKIVHSKNKKLSFLGIVSGVLLLLITFFI